MSKVSSVTQERIRGQDREERPSLRKLRTPADGEELSADVRPERRWAEFCPDLTSSPAFGSSGADFDQEVAALVAGASLRCRASHRLGAGQADVPARSLP